MLPLLLPPFSIRPSFALHITGAVVFANVVLDQHCAPLGLLAAPLVAVRATALVVQDGPKWPLWAQAGCCAGLLALQDVGLKLTGGGSHDHSGQGLLNLLFLLGAVLSVGVFAQHAWRDRAHSWLHRMGAWLGFGLVLVLHFHSFRWLGYGLSLPSWGV